MGKKEKKEETTLENEGTPLCEKCGNLMIIEDDEWFCSHCQGEINFLGEDDE